MTKDICYAVSQIKTIVPAVQPAWVRLVSRYPSGGDGVTGCWDDRVLPVLAYGVATTNEKWEAAGMYLVVDTDGSPSWLDSRLKSDILIIFSINEKPAAGEPVQGFTDGLEHDPTDDMECDFNWIFR